MRECPGLLIDEQLFRHAQVLQLGSGRDRVRKDRRLRLRHLLHGHAQRVFHAGNLDRVRQFGLSVEPQLYRNGDGVLQPRLGPALQSGGRLHLERHDVHRNPGRVRIECGSDCLLELDGLFVEGVRRNRRPMLHTQLSPVSEPTGL